MKKFTKITAVALAAASMLTAFAGCSGNNSGNEDIPTLTWLVPGTQQNGTAAMLEEFNKISVERVGAKLDLQFIDQSSFQERMQLNMASKNDYDLCFVGFLNPYHDAVDKKGLYKMDELLEATPDLKESIDDYAWEAVTYGDGIYAVPNMQIHATSTGLFIQKKFIDKYNFDVSKITKTTDIEPLLEQIKQNEPDVYPFRTSWGGASFNHLDVGGDAYENIIAEKSGCNVVQEGDSFKVKAVDPSKEGENYKRAKLLYDWFQKGYIRKDVASVMDDEHARIAGKYAAWIDVYKPGVDAEYQNNTGIEVVAIPITKSRISAGSVIQTMIGIGANSKYPEKAMKMIELLNTDKAAYNIICYGIEGKNYTKIGDNRIEIMETNDYNPNASWKFGNQFNAYILPTQSDTVWEETIELNTSAPVTKLFAFAIKDDEIKPEIARIDQVQDDYPELNNGSADPDTYWDKYIAALNEAGIETVRANIEKQVEAYLAANN